jgi:hypothetical protein
MNKQTKNRTNKQIDKQTKIPVSGTIEFQSYFKFWCSPPASNPGVGI